MKHYQASAYHAQSQGASERFHQTLKSLLRGYCVELNQDWEEGLPWLLLAAREVVQESTGFSPNKLVFGPLALLHDPVALPEPPQNLIDYVNGFRHRLYTAGERAKESLASAQTKMKHFYGRKAEIHQFSPGVLAFLQLVSSTFQTNFHGPFTVLRQVSEKSYLLSTPKRGIDTQFCHVNLLKPYYTKGSQFCATGGSGQQQTVKPVLMAETVARHSAAKLSVYEDDGVVSPDEGLLRGHLKNAESLGNCLDICPWSGVSSCLLCLTTI